jgi:hypothetical protein
MTDREIRAAWLDSYPKWNTDPDALHVCRLMCQTIIKRALTSAGLGSVENQIICLCADIGIPRTQFEEVRRLVEPRANG